MLTHTGTWCFIYGVLNIFFNHMTDNIVISAYGLCSHPVSPDSLVSNMSKVSLKQNKSWVAELG